MCKKAIEIRIKLFSNIIIVHFNSFSRKLDSGKEKVFVRERPCFSLKKHTLITENETI